MDQNGAGSTHLAGRRAEPPGAVPASLLIDNIGLLWTMAGQDEPGAAGPRQGREAMREVGSIRHAAVAVGRDGTVLAAGDRRTVRSFADRDTRIFDAKGGFSCPGLVDPHTHLVHGGSRETELPLRLAGRDYLEILAEGGGILRTVRDTRARSQESLYRQAAVSAGRLLSFGVTTLEAKTGYGLRLKDELRQLGAARQISDTLPLSVVHTALPAHALPAEFRGRQTAYVQSVIDMLPALKEAGAEFCDVFVEDGVFSADEGREILLAGRAAGLHPKVHADELAPCGGAELAAELQAASADHLLSATDDGLFRLSKAGVIAVCLPGTSFYLQRPPARARFMIDEANLAVALASDYNPGSSPSENFGLILTLALLTLRMTPEEIFMAATRNSACAVRRGDRAGSIAPGRPADIVVFDAPNPEYVLTHYGINHVRAVFKNGVLVLGGA